MTYEKEQQLTELSKTDPIYQNLLQQCLSLEYGFLRIRSGLREEDQETLDRYISACEELEYRRTLLALAL